VDTKTLQARFVSRMKKWVIKLWEGKKLHADSKKAYIERLNFMAT